MLAHAVCLRCATGHFLATGVRYAVIFLCHGPILCPQISRFGLYLPSQGRVCARRSARVCFFLLRAVPRACRLRTTPLGYYCRERGSEACAWALWAVVWIPDSLTDGWSLFLSLAILFSSAREPPRHSLLPPPPHPLQMKTLPLVSRGEGRICHSVLEECIKRVLICR